MSRWDLDGIKTTYGLGWGSKDGSSLGGAQTPDCTGRECSLASLRLLGTGWANMLGVVLASTDPASGLRDGVDGFLRSSQGFHAGRDTYSSSVCQHLSSRGL